MDKEPDTHLYVPEEILGLVGEGFNKNAIELSKTFNVTPRKIGTVAVAKSGGGSRIHFNGELTSDELESLPEYSNNDDYSSSIRVHPGRAILDPEQKENARGIRPSIAQLAGRIGIGGAAATGTLYETALVTGHEVSGSVVAAAVLGAAYQVDRLRVAARHRKAAKSSLKNLNQHFVDEDEGCITFKNNWFNLEIPTVELSREEMESRKVWRLTEKFDGIQPHDYYYSGKDYYTVDVSAGALVKDLLKNEANTQELWATDFGKQVRELSDVESRVITAKEALTGVIDRANFTGQSIPDERERCETELEQSKKQLVEIAITLAGQCLERNNIHKAGKVIDEIINGDVETSHPLELQLQVFHTVVTRAVASLDLSQEKNLETVKSVAQYLKGTRSRLSDRSQIKQFYDGLYAKYSDELPNLTDWDNVAAEFSGDTTA